MADDKHMCWINCCDLEGEAFLCDQQRTAIDKMQQAIEPLDRNTAEIRRLITRFESCYHEADKEAELIINAIAAGRCPEKSNERPPYRKQELQNSRDILSAWTSQRTGEVKHIKAGDIGADELLSCLGQQTALKTWQVRRVIDKIDNALDGDRPYHALALKAGGYGEPAENNAEQIYANDLEFLRQTTKTIIHDTVDGQKAEISLAMAIDLLMPCHWNFIGSLCTILNAINGNTTPARPLTCCARNLHLSPLCDRLSTIAKTLEAYCQDNLPRDDTDDALLAILAEQTDVKRWLAASLGKTIRYQLVGEFPVSLI